MHDTTLLTSTVVAAVVAGLISFATQRHLLERKATIDYELPAKQRLYQALGPLRLQLIFASRDVVRRVTLHPGTNWNLNPADYYARSFIWRLLRPLAVAALIERQLAVADFSVDPGALDLLRLKAAMEEMLTGGEVLLDHPKADWAAQTDHLFGDNLRSAAGKLLVVNESGGTRVLEFEEFVRDFPDLGAVSGLAELARIFETCRPRATLQANPVFWLRVVGYAFVCNQLVQTQGARLGFESAPLDVLALLRGAQDEHIASRLDAYQPTFDVIIARSL